jgi:hypothetical protein
VAHGSIRIDYNSVVVGGEDETNNLGLEQFASTTWTLPCGCPNDRIVDGTQGPEQSAHVDRAGYILAVAIMGASIQLPTMLYSRQGCHYQGHCKGDYSWNVPIWNVYDKETTLRLLREFGICIVEQESPSSMKNDTLQLVPGRMPLTTSQLIHEVHDGLLGIVDNGVLWFKSAAPNSCPTRWKSLIYCGRKTLPSRPLST